MSSIKISLTGSFKLLSFVFCMLFLSLQSCTTSRKTTSTRGADAKELRLRNDISESAENLIGTTYKYGGNTPSSGFDCSGLTVFVMQQHGVGLDRVSRDQAKMGKKIPLNRAKAGDLVFFAKRGQVFHVALVVEHNKEGIFIVHSTSSGGVIRENLSTSSYWKPKIKEARDVISHL